MRSTLNRLVMVLIAIAMTVATTITVAAAPAAAGPGYPSNCYTPAPNLEVGSVVGMQSYVSTHDSTRDAEGCRYVVCRSIEWNGQLYKPWQVTWDGDCWWQQHPPSGWVAPPPPEPEKSCPWWKFWC